MKAWTESGIDATSLVGIVAGLTALMPALFVSELAFLAAPALCVLLLSLLAITR